MAKDKARGVKLGRQPKLTEHPKRDAIHRRDADSETLVDIACSIDDAKAQFRPLAEPWADTGTGRLMLAVLGGLADVERDLIRTRTA